MGIWTCTDQCSTLTLVWHSNPCATMALWLVCGQAAVGWSMEHSFQLLPPVILEQVFNLIGSNATAELNGKFWFCYKNYKSACSLRSFTTGLIKYCQTLIAEKQFCYVRLLYAMSWRPRNASKVIQKNRSRWLSKGDVRKITIHCKYVVAYC